jgi:hypothetical protein
MAYQTLKDSDMMQNYRFSDKRSDTCQSVGLVKTAERCRQGWVATEGETTNTRLLRKET